MDWCHPYSGQVLPSYLTQSKNSFKDMLISQSLGDSGSRQADKQYYTSCSDITLQMLTSICMSLETKVAGYCSTNVSFRKSTD